MFDNASIDVSHQVSEYSCQQPLDKFRSEAKMGTVVCPVKIFHGRQDTLIAISHGERLYQLLRNRRFEPTWIDRAGHNDILSMTKGMWGTVISV